MCESVLTTTRLSEQSLFDLLAQVSRNTFLSFVAFFLALVIPVSVSHSAKQKGSVGAGSDSTACDPVLASDDYPLAVPA